MSSAVVVTPDPTLPTMAMKRLSLSRGGSVLIEQSFLQRGHTSNHVTMPVTAAIIVDGHRATLNTAREMMPLAIMEAAEALPLNSEAPVRSRFVIKRIGEV